MTKLDISEKLAESDWKLTKGETDVYLMYIYTLFREFTGPQSWRVIASLHYVSLLNLK